MELVAVFFRLSQVQKNADFSQQAVLINAF